MNPGGQPNGSDLGWSAFAFATPVTDQHLFQQATPFATPAVTTQTAIDAYNQIIQYVGNSWASRDAIDTRIINNVLNNTGAVINTPNATDLSNLLAAPMTTRPAGYDSDNDGMPNAWELSHGLNPNSAADAGADFDGDGYVNVVEYLNEAGEIPAPAPIVWNGATNARYAQITNWKTNDGGVTAGSNWEPSKYDTAMIHTATVAMDAVGQHAGTLELAPAAGDAATFNVAGGWIDVGTAVHVGAAGAATVNHSGGMVMAPSIVLGGSGGAAGVYNLSGSGFLRVGTLSKGASGGSFNMTGGVLAADTVAFSLVNQGGVISPGASPGTTHVMGDLTLSAGTLEIELGGTVPGQFDRLLVDGTTSLGGTLKVDLVDLGGGAFVPQLGDVFPILAANGGAGGTVVALDLPTLAPGLEWALNPGNVTMFLSVVSAAGNPADFNHDGVVDSDDLAVWTGNFGASSQTDNAHGDANGDGSVDGADFIVWQQELGAAAAVAANATVPEPDAAVLAVLSCTAILFRRAQRRSAPAIQFGDDRRR